MTTRKAITTSNSWDDVAVEYDRHITPTGNWALPKRALQLAGIKPSMRFLDLASGSGALGLPAARQDAYVHCVDSSPAMIERLYARAGEERLTRLSGEVMDGTNLLFQDNEFDISGSQFGVMSFPDFRKGLEEMIRVTKPGGVVFLIVLGALEKLDFLNIPLHAANKIAPALTLPSQLPLQAPKASGRLWLHHFLQNHALNEVKTLPADLPPTFHSGTAWWNWVVHFHPVLFNTFSRLDAQQQNQVEQILDQRLKYGNRDWPNVATGGNVAIAFGKKSRNMNNQKIEI